MEGPKGPPGSRGLPGQGLPGPKVREFYEVQVPVLFLLLRFLIKKWSASILMLLKVLNTNLKIDLLQEIIFHFKSIFYSQCSFLFQKNTYIPYRLAAFHVNSAACCLI